MSFLFIYRRHIPSPTDHAPRFQSTVKPVIGCKLLFSTFCNHLTHYLNIEQSFTDPSFLLWKMASEGAFMHLPVLTTTAPSIQAPINCFSGQIKRLPKSLKPNPHNSIFWCPFCSCVRQRYYETNTWYYQASAAIAGRELQIFMSKVI